MVIDREAAAYWITRSSRVTTSCLRATPRPRCSRRSW